MRSMDGIFLGSLLILFLFVWAAAVSYAEERVGEAAYGVASWPRGYGNHRAVIEVASEDEAVRVRIPWRRRDADPEQKEILVIDGQSGERVKNVARIGISRALGDLVFEPTSGPGRYYVYYMPYRHEGPPHQFRTVYLKPEDTGVEAAWLVKNLQKPAFFEASALEALDEAEVVGMEARSEADRMDPMEVIATEAEVAELAAEQPKEALVFFTEDAAHSIRMQRDLPFRWVKRGPNSVYRAQVKRGEYHAFQVGLWALGRDYIISDAIPGNLRSEDGQTIRREALTCFNVYGVDWRGNPCKAAVLVPKDEVRALWFGISVSENTVPGLYKGQLIIQPESVEKSLVDLEIEVVDEIIPNHGFDDPARLARLAWLDSQIGLNDTVTAPYTPLEREGGTIQCLNRAISFAANGLPEQIQSNRMDLLAAPMAMRFETAGGPVAWGEAKERRHSRETSPATITWECEAQSGPLSYRCRPRMDYDGYVNFRVTVEAEKDTAFTNAVLEIPLDKAVATYMMGLGKEGGYRPETWDYAWNMERANHSVWLGSPQAGLHCKLKDAGDSWNLYNLHASGWPESWANGGQGGCTLRETDDAVVLTAFTGPFTLAARKEIRFDFGLLVTPVKPLDPQHWNWRYCHQYVPVDEIKAAGANIVNIHHGNELNPYINYPFLSTEALGAYVHAAHAEDIRVKIYYTVRELSTFCPEVWPLRSLGFEVFTDGPGGGASWLCEHLIDHYAPAWHHPFPDGTVDRSIATTGLSRWHNYYLEGLAWLLDNVKIDGLYLDGIGYNREIMQRVRRVLDQHRPGSLIDFHSGNNFHPNYGLSNCANQYLEHFPYIDSLWFGEGFDYNKPPDYWLVEISGIPFGLFGEMLQGGGNPWRGMIYGMTNRYGWQGDPRALWEVWDAFGIQDAVMHGYWDPDCPVHTDCEDVLATAYVKPAKTLVSLASWVEEEVPCRLEVDWDAVGLKANQARFRAPAIPGFQEAAQFAPTDPIPVPPDKGWLLIIEATP